MHFFKYSAVPLFAIGTAAFAAATKAPASGAGSSGQGLTINFVNKHNASIVAWNANDATFNIPKVVAGRTDSIILPNNMTVYHVDAPWSGGFQVNTAAHGITGQDSLVEGSLFYPQGLFLDVSNVPGFTLPIVCGCEEKGMILGCNRDLRALNGGCPQGSDNGRGVCVNQDAEENYVHNFFLPCKGGSYAYTTDHLVQNDGLCNGNVLTCCVGTNCPDSYKQPNANNTGFHIGLPSESSANLTSTFQASTVNVSIHSPDFVPSGRQILPFDIHELNSTHNGSTVWADVGNLTYLIL